MLGLGNPRQMEALFKQLGIKTKEIEAEEVTIKTKSGNIIVKNPKVTEIEMKGMKTFQISGEIEESKFSQEDVKFVMENTGVDEETARKALEETGDIAGAILKLQNASP